jgi:intracellular septation protein
MVPLVSAVFVALFGALTLWLHSDLFIKVKVTLINALFGAVLLGGVAMGRSYIKLIMGEAVKLTEEAWRTLSIRWGCSSSPWRRSTKWSGAISPPING